MIMDEALQKQDPFIPIWKKNYSDNIQNFEFDKQYRIGVKQISVRKISRHACYLVNPGPSLEKNISKLKEIYDQKNSTIICSDVSLYRLIEVGIIPDIVCTVDPSDITRYWHPYHEITKEIVLVASTVSNQKSISYWKGPIAFFNPVDDPQRYSWRSKFFRNLCKRTSNYGGFLNLGSVMLTMMQVSQLINASVIFLVGCDFSFEDNKVYCNGFMERRVHTDIKTTDDINSDKMLNLPEYNEIKEKFKHDWDCALKEFKTKLIEDEIKTYHQVQVQFKNSDIKMWTNQALLLYKKYLLLFCQNIKSKVFNCTEGGILTEIQSIPLNESTDFYSQPEQKRFKEMLF